VPPIQVQQQAQQQQALPAQVAALGHHLQWVQ
jgi:hypothetical protein